MRIERFFSEDDLLRIEEAVRAAEGRTSGEIVPYAVERSDAYASGIWRATTTGAFAGAMLAALASGGAELWGPPPVLWIVAPTACGAAVAFLLAAAFGPVRRLFIPGPLMAERVSERADQAFLEEEVFATRERTGILVFLSLFERRVVVRADRGIAAVVAQSEWDGVVSTIVDGIRSGRTGEALARGILACGEILERHRVDRRVDDRDELRDGLRIGEP